MKDSKGSPQMKAPQLEERNHPGRWGILALLMLVSAGQQFHRIGLAVLGPDIMKEYGIEEVSMGGLYSVFLYTYTLLMIPGGFVADRLGTWGALVIVMAGSSIFGALTGSFGWLVSTGAAAWWWIAVCRGSMGVLSAPLYPSTARTVAGWFAPSQRVLGNSLVVGAALAGIAAANKVLSLLSPKVGWRVAFLIAGGATAAITLAWVVLGRSGPWGRGPAPRPKQRQGGDEVLWMRLWRSFLRHPGIVALTLSYATVGYFEYLFFYWMPYYFEKILHLTKEESGTYTMATSIAMMLMTPLGGFVSLWAVRRFGFRRGLRGMAMSSMSLAAGFLLLGALTDQLEWKTAWLSLALGFIGASEGPFWTAAIHLGGSSGAACGGFVNTGGNLLGVLAPIATPWIAGLVNASAWGQAAANPALGWSAALIAGSIVCLVGVSFWLWVDADRPLDGA